MTTTAIRGVWRATCASALLFGSGCTGNLLQSDAPAPDTFRLNVIAGAATAAPVVPAGSPAAASGAAALAIAVARPRAPSALDTDRIAVAGGASRFDYYADARWAEAAPQMLQENLVGTLTDAGGFAGVFAAPARVPTELLLDVELRRFEAVSGATGAAPVVHVQAQASLVDSRRRARVTSFVSEAAVPATENRLGAVIVAFERANAQVVLDIAQRVQAAAAALPVK